MKRHLLSRTRLFLLGVAMLTLVIVVEWTPRFAFATTSLTAAFDFDTGFPTFVEGQSTPLNQTSGAITAYFSSPFDPAAFSVQSYDTTFF